MGASYTAEEVTRAFFEMHPTKAPGIDGFSALFYQKLWAFIKEDVCRDILLFLNCGRLDKRLTRQ